jgi:hypothetical protein
MGRAGAGLLAAALALGLAAPAGAAPASERVRVVAPDLSLVPVVVDLPRPVRGARALRLLGDRVDDAAALNGLTGAALTELLETDRTAWLSSGGRLHFKDPADPRAEAGLVAGAAPSYPLDQTFALHSKPGSQRTIFIDVDGATVSGTVWNSDYPTIPTSQPSWDPAGNGAAFNDAEKGVVQDVWARVAEDFAPFDVDVTTQDPGAAAIRRSSAGDQVYGAHALVSASGAMATLCGGTCGGIAFIDVFDKVVGAGGNGYGVYQPAWVFPQGTGDTAKGVAEAVSHEVGHQLGLVHDANAVEGYDWGHGAWAPIMGAGYSRPISQWSKGDYSTADNHEDDVAMIRAILGERTDEAPSVILGAPTVPTGPAYISSRTDVDTYRLSGCSGAVTIAVAPLLAAGANLDARVRLLDQLGGQISTADPPSAMVNESQASGLGATISTTLAAGSYHVEVDGVGNGSWSTGYDDYGSLGAYTVAVTGCQTDGVPGAPRNLGATATTASTVALAWEAPVAGSSPVTGYVLTRTGSGTEVTLGATATSYTWTGLAITTPYVFSVAAVNAQGRGPAASVTALTTATVPSAPQALAATWQSARGRALVTWGVPSSDGGSAVTGYDVLVDGVQVGTTAETEVHLTGTFSPGPHTIGVAARNPVGRGPVAGTTLVVPPAPANDAFAARQVLTGATGTVGGDNETATAEAGDPVPPMIPGVSSAGAASVWYSWTAPATGPVSMSTGPAASGRDTTLAAYTGSTLGSLVLVAGNDDVSDTDYLSRIAFTATAGTTYAVAVDGYRTYDGGVGPFTLGWAGPAAPVPTLPTVPTVPPAPTVVASGTTVTAPRTVRVRSRPTVSVTVVRGPAPATGTVVLRYGAKSVTLTLTGGRATVRLPRLKAGKLRLGATYAGDATTLASAGAAVIKVKKR